MYKISFKICGKSGQVKIDPGKSVFQLLTWMGKQGSILSIHTVQKALAVILIIFFIS